MTRSKLFRLNDGSEASCGYRLKLTRKALGLNQKQMAESAGMSVNAYQFAEGGRSYLRPPYVQNLFETIGIDHNFIYRGDASRLPVDIADSLERAAKDADATS